MLADTAAAIVMIHNTVANLCLFVWHAGAYRGDYAAGLMPRDV